MKITLFQGILFGVFALAAFIGVFVFATHTSTNKSSGPASIGPVVIWGTLPKANMQNFLLSAAQTNQLLKDVTYVQKSQETLPTDLASAIATGNAPDLLLTSQEDLHALSKFIVQIPASTLPPSTFENTFVQSGRILMTPDASGYYGIPFAIDPLVLFSNRTILSSNGIAKPPATWEALTGLVPSIATLTSTKQVSRGLIALGAYGNVHNARAILSSLFLQTGVPISSYRNGVLSANLSGSTSGEVSAGKAVLSFYTQFADPSKTSYTWNTSLPDSQQAFQNGDLALYLGFASETRFLKSANPNLDFSVSPLPQPATASSKNAYSLLYSFMIPRGAKNPNGAYQAAASLTSSAIQPVVAQNLGIAPATLTALSTPPGDPVAAVAYGEALYSSAWLSPAAGDTDSIFSSMITGVISGRLTPESALTSSEGALTSLLQK